jgi:putative ABC transport system permease protein
MSLIADIRLSLRTLAKNPGFTAVAITMLALGIGINATVFTLTNDVLFKGFPDVKGNDRLRYLSYKNSNCCVAYPDFLDWKTQSKSFEGMAIVHGIATILSDDNGFTERHDVTEVSSGTFQLLGRRPILGRDFTPMDEAPGADPVTMLNYEFWETQFGKDPGVIGRTLKMSGVPTTVIGVMPQGFTFPQKLELWVPLVQTSKVMKRENRDTWMVVGRLAEGVTVQAAQTEMEIIGKQLAAAYPDTNRDRAPEIQTFSQFFLGPDAATLYTAMWGAVGFVLLIACANLANLMLARAIGRAREISVRIALGAGRWRIIRQLLIESVILSGLGGFIGWWIARLSLRAYQLAMASKSSWLILDYRMDGRVLAYLIAISIGTGLLFGLAPALRLSKLDVNSSLKDGGRSATGSGHGNHLSALLVTCEMALAVVLLAGAGLMIRSFLKVHNANLGVNMANILVTSVSPPEARYPSGDQRISFFDHLQVRLEAIPGVESIAMANSIPAWGSEKYGYEIAAEAPVEDSRRPRVSVLVITPNYFRILGATVLSGRDFKNTDGTGIPVAIVNQRLAVKIWPGQDPLGKRLRLFNRTGPEEWLTVIGVVSNILQDDPTRQEFGPLVYLPNRQKPQPSLWALARTRIPPLELRDPFRREVVAIDSGVSIYGPFALEDRLDMFLDSRFYGVLFLIFAAVALLLASVGLYAVIANSVTRRTQELGIRMAIGATARDIISLVFRQGMIPLAMGLIVGLIASLAVNRVLKSMLVKVSPYDPITLAVATGVLVLSAMLGCWIPARRAMRVDPVVALRHD